MTLSTKSLLRKTVITAGFALALCVLPNSPVDARDLCGGKSRAVQCQTRSDGRGNGFYSLDMDPRFNRDVDPRFNLQADPRFNMKADPRFNIKADPRFNPFAKPCDLGIGRDCK